MTQQNNFLCVLRNLFHIKCKERYNYIFLSTDFGYHNASALCEAAIYKKNPDVKVIHSDHTLRTFDIEYASIILQRTKDLPNKSIVVAVVDPGVGTERQSVILKVKSGLFFVGPNNGIFTDVANEFGVEALYQIESKKVREEWQIGTFDGRDLYAPAAF